VLVLLAARCCHQPQPTFCGFAERRTQKTLALTRTQMTQIKKHRNGPATQELPEAVPSSFSCRFCGLLRSREARLRVLRLPFDHTHQAARQAQFPVPSSQLAVPVA